MTDKDYNQRQNVLMEEISKWSPAGFSTRMYNIPDVQLQYAGWNQQLHKSVCIQFKYNEEKE